MVRRTDALRILFASAEIAPWVKTGGLGDVTAALPPAVRNLGLDLRVLVPAYPALLKAFANAPVVAELTGLGGELPAAALREATTAEGVPLLLLDCPALFDRPGNPYLDVDGRDWPDNALRFALLSRVAALLGSAATPLAWRAQLIHCNDWQTALAPCYLHYGTENAENAENGQRQAASLLTVHNLAFQGLFGGHLLGALGLPSHAWAIDGVEYHGHLSFLKGGLQFADWITTVSPSYAREIQTTEEGMGLDGLLRWRSERLTGILNGIDTTAWNPQTDEHLATHYDIDHLSGKAANKAALQKQCGLPVRADVPLLGVVSRMTEQKGLDLLPPLAAEIAALPAQLVVLGSGSRALEQAFLAMAKAHPEQIAVTIGFDEALSHQIEAGVDLFLMPSRFEPCGLNQMYSLRYGSPPLVRRTGGLGDTVVDATAAAMADGSANGFVFEQPDSTELIQTLRRALAMWHTAEEWRGLQRSGMASDWGWAKPARRYAALYQRLIDDSQTGLARILQEDSTAKTRKRIVKRLDKK